MLVTKSVFKLISVLNHYQTCIYIICGNYDTKCNISLLLLKVQYLACQKGPGMDKHGGRTVHGSVFKGYTPQNEQIS